MNATPKRVYLPERGDIVWLIFDPRVGHEQSGRRPALVLSPQLFTERTGLAVVCPITSKIKGLPFEVPVQHGQADGSVLPVHVRSVDVAARKAQFIEKAPQAVVDTVSEYLRIIIGEQ